MKSAFGTYPWAILPHPPQECGGSLIPGITCNKERRHFWRRAEGATVKSASGLHPWASLCRLVRLDLFGCFLFTWLLSRVSKGTDSRAPSRYDSGKTSLMVWQIRD